MDLLKPPPRPCNPGCRHTGSCGVADERRAAAGHPVRIFPRPKMDAQGLVAATCGCGRYSSNPSSIYGAMGSWRQHADDTLAAGQDGIRPHLPRTPQDDARAEAILSTLPPLTAEDARRQGLLPERTPQSQCTDMGMGMIPMMGTQPELSQDRGGPEPQCTDMLSAPPFWRGG